MSALLRLKLTKYGLCECGERFERHSNAQRYCQYCATARHLYTCRAYRDKIRPNKQPVLCQSQWSVDWVALEWEVYFSVKRTVALIRANDELLRDGGRYRHRAALFPEAQYARDLPNLPRKSRV